MSDVDESKVDYNYVPDHLKVKVKTGAAFQLASGWV